VKVTLLKTDGKYYLYKKVMDGLKPNADYTEFTEMKFVMNELYLGSIVSGISVGYVADVDNFETAVSAAEEELFHLAKEA
jgi:hypothetical protein